MKKTVSYYYELDSEISKKAIMLNLKVKFVNAYDVFRSMQVYY